MYIGIDPKKAEPYVLRRDDHNNPTIWWLLPQTVAKGNRHLVRYQDAQTKKTLDSVAAKTTQEDLAQFLSTVESVENFQLLGESAPREKVAREDRETLTKIFYEIDIASFNELMNASRDIFELKEEEKNGSGSSSGQDSAGKKPTGSDTIAKTATSTEGGPAGNA